MAKNIQKETAIILQFPVRPRALRGTPSTPQTIAERRDPLPVCDAAGDNSWYHDHAIQNADPNRRH